jgi:hypothetical protein
MERSAERRAGTVTSGRCIGRRYVTAVPPGVIQFGCLIVLLS